MSNRDCFINKHKNIDLRVRVNGKAKDRKEPLSFQALREDASSLMPVGSSTLDKKVDQESSRAVQQAQIKQKKRRIRSSAQVSC